MHRYLSLALCLLSTTAFAADTMGTWKLNTAKSKYTGMAAPKEMTVVYSPQGAGWKYSAKGTSAKGEPINSSFIYVKDGDEIATTGFPLWDGLVLTNAKAAEATGAIKRQGKAVGNLSRTISADGKTMTIRGKLTGPDGKPVTYDAVYEKQ
jgi:hypothetical protein